MAKYLFTSHFHERMAERELPVALVFEALETGSRKRIKGKPWQELYFGDNVGVILEDGWKIVTAWWLIANEAGGRAKRRWAEKNSRRSLDSRPKAC